MSLPTLRTERLTLRPFATDDVDSLHELWTDPDVRRYLWDDVTISREKARDTVHDAIASAESGGLGLWVVLESGSDAPAGFCGLIQREGEEHPELMYGLAPRCWHRGFATEASRAVLDYAFEVLACERVRAATDPPNVASVRVMERLGMRFVRRGALNGLDTLFYEIRASIPDMPPR